MFSGVSFQFLTQQHDKVSALINNDRETVGSLIIVRDQITSTLENGDAGDSNIVATVNTINDLIDSISFRIACRFESLDEIEASLGIE